ncbi:MAG TPA: flagellar FlbD family protein [Spirochaetota bacterium]|jgi:flagellar protein FlbD|nr:flagellar FlbD family protein [Spirochaetota bacterium]HOH37428.1 flagellar FlbD family protein [Spirochaetota bacterium]HPM34185.1 flagellar FlbD family protein [Spirochaetota bacterium]HPW51978.1 flagellar FlbD family protein [Spirochaetota bacterium]HPY03141.1 flagellar FlbD family protein [Spirochaetota bacterium]
MIVLHRLNGTEFLLNEDHIETMEETPDMIILLTNDRKYIVKEKREEILALIQEYKQKIYK